MVFTSPTYTAAGASRGHQFLSVERLHAEQVDYTHCDAGLLQFFIGGQSLKDRYSGRNHQCLVPIASPQNFAFADGERLIRSVEDRRIGAAQSQVPGASALRN